MITPRETIYAAFWAAVTAATVIASDPAIAIPAAPGPYTLTPLKGWVADVGVVYSPSMTPLVVVPSSPTVGQYSVTAGVYTFNAADTGNLVIITYVTPAFLTMGRRLQHWDNVPSDQQPAMFMMQHQQAVRQKAGLPPMWNLHLSLFVYDNCQSDTTAIPGQRLNYLLDAIDNALAPAGGSGGYQTLAAQNGGLPLVSHCWIAGPIELYEGYLGMMDQSVAIIPIEIRVPDASGAGP